MKNNFNTFIILFLLFIIAALLRLWGLNSDGALWFDEYCSYNAIYTNSFWKVRELAMTAGALQPPLYFWCLWIWVKLFGGADYTMRLLSLFFGSINVIVAYFCGRELELTQKTNENPSRTGVIFSILYAVSGIAIYYSQEVRHYPLIMLLSTILVLAILRLMRKFSNTNLIFFFIANLLLLYTYIFAYVFCFFEFLVLFVYFYKIDKNYLKKLAILSVILGILCIPVICDFVKYVLPKGESGGCWGRFGLTAVFSLINNYTTPMIININDFSLSFEKIFSNADIFILFSIFSTPCITIYIAGAAKSIINNNYSRYLFVIPMLFLIFLAFLNIQEKVTFLIRYNLIAFPFFLLLISHGFSLFKSRFVNAKNILCVIVLLNLVFTIIFPAMSAQFRPKTIFSTNFMDLSRTLNRCKFSAGDDFVIMYYGSTDRFVSAPKYFDFSGFKTYIFDDCQFNYVNRNKCRFEVKTELGAALSAIKQHVSPGRKLVIAMPANIFETYETTITDANLRTGYKKVVKLDENNWITLIYSN